MTNFNLIDAFMGVAAQRPDCEALGTPENTHTYADLVGLASQCARYFERRGIRAGDRIAIALSQSDQTVVALLASWMLGATSVIIDARSKAMEKAQIAECFGLRAIVETRSSLGQSGHDSIVMGDNLPDTIASESSAPCFRPASFAPALVLRTSGTTGTPQGIVLDHETVMQIHWALGSTFLGFNRGLLVHSMPLFYASGLLRSVSQLLDGGPLHILPSIASAEELAEKLLSARARAASVVPAQLHRLLELSGGRSTPLFPDLKVLAGTGATFPAETALRAYHELSNNFCVSYGASVCSSISLLAGQDLLAKPDSVGRPQPFNHLRIADPEGRPVKPGETGLLMVRGPTLASALIGEPRANSDRISDGWAIPGDMGFIDEEGFLNLTGRASDLIIRKGVNVFPREIEQVLERHDAVVEAAVIGYPDDGAGEEIAAFVVVRGDLTLDQLRYHARAHIPVDKRPRIIRIVDALPRNDAGKLRKRVLVEELTAGNVG